MDSIEENGPPNWPVPPGELSRQAEDRGIPLHILEMPSLRSFPRLAWLRTVHALARGIDADLVYANTARGALYSAPSVILSGLPFIWHMRDFSFLESRNIPWVDRLLKRLVSGRASVVVANSRAVARTAAGPASRTGGSQRD